LINRRALGYRRVRRPIQLRPFRLFDCTDERRPQEPRVDRFAHWRRSMDKRTERPAAAIVLPVQLQG